MLFTHCLSILHIGRVTQSPQKAFLAFFSGVRELPSDAQSGDKCLLKSTRLTNDPQQNGLPYSNEKDVAHQNTQRECEKMSSDFH